MDYCPDKALYTFVHVLFRGSKQGGKIQDYWHKAYKHYCILFTVSQIFTYSKSGYLKMYSINFIHPFHSTVE